MEEVSIQPKHYLTCLWPGMAELWWRGRLSALPAAIAFAGVLNALLIAKFIYSDWLSGGLVMLACWVVIAAWLVLAIRSIRELPLLLTPRLVSDEPDRFPEAQVAFLRGDYASAEDYLTACLSIEPRDPPALLMLSSVYRHTGRLHASELLLSEIRKLEVAQKWDLEFQTEEARLERDIEARDQDGEEQDTGEQNTGGQETGGQETGEQNMGEQDAAELAEATSSEHADESIDEPGKRIKASTKESRRAA
ncbi:hypothetical protein Pla100_24430 [Neorhodopirellula pilleata]|uniref:Tetratricopeptide repeat protein n=2 Tax=Neorhodopirellula pilleata TaxID=2714738 RepID=A0A5C6AB68_9BACT|nr:tetratricopeptide repeat protein [Neorhodopirellula pilleata]TWT97292.1 hypothetical protein Pla100_24430 [Neorhodopirellula pilleata]